MSESKKEERYVIKVTWLSGHFCGISDYITTRYEASTQFLPKPKDKELMYKYGYKSRKTAEACLKRTLGKKYISIPALKWWKMWDEKIRYLPKKKRDDFFVEQYEKIKDEYKVEIMTVGEAYDDLVTNIRIPN